MKANFLLSLIFLSAFCSTISGRDLDGFQASIDQLLEARAGLEESGYTSTEILKERLSPFTGVLLAEGISDSQKGDWSSFHTGCETNSRRNFAERHAFIVIPQIYK